MDFVDQIKGAVSGHDDQIEGAIDKGGDFIDSKTDGKYAGQVDQVQQVALAVVDQAQEVSVGQVERHGGWSFG